MIKYLKKLINDILTVHFIRNVFNKTYEKKVLICYVIKPFNKYRRVKKLFHQNNWTSINIAKVFDKLNYQVDIINYSDLDIQKYLKSNNKYDIIFGMGAAFYQASILFPNTKKIFFATGLPGKMTNDIEQSLLIEFNKKNGTKFKPTRTQNILYESYAKYDEIVALGNSNQIINFKKFTDKKIYTIDDNISETLITLEKPLTTNQGNRKSFLFQASVGKFISGLPLLLEFFKKRDDLELHILCSFNKEEDVYKYFENDLNNIKNIHYYGNFVPFGTKEFQDIVDKCSATIVPVAAAGQNGVALTSMSYGLYPIISKECNIDLPENCGIYINRLDVKGLDDAINKYLSLSMNKISNDRSLIQKHTLEHYSSQQFRDRFENIINSIIN